MFEKSFKSLNFELNGTHPSFTVLAHFENQFTTGKLKILLEPKISGKTTSLAISNNVSPRSQKNHIILVKLSKNIFLDKNWVQIPPRGRVKGLSGILT